MCKIPVSNIVLSDPCINKLDYTSVIYMCVKTTIVLSLLNKPLVNSGH